MRFVSRDRGHSGFGPGPAGFAPLSALPLERAGDFSGDAGPPAPAQVAPDWTHLASRRSIAAGTFPMTRGHLYAWIADPQGAKPGNNMPVVGLEPEELHSVVAYLETLK